MEGNTVIYELREADERFVPAIASLLRQLSSSHHAFTIENLRAIVCAPSSHLYVAEVDGVIAGMLTLCEYIVPTGRKMWIEDVVVDEAMRGRALGRRLVEHAVSEAGTLGGGSLMLTSRPSRVAANALYRSCGFLLKETNCYKIEVYPE